MSWKPEIDELERRRALARETRPILCRWARLAAGSLTTGPQAFTYRP